MRAGAGRHWGAVALGAAQSPRSCASGAASAASSCRHGSRAAHGCSTGPASAASSSAAARARSPRAVGRRQAPREQSPAPLAGYPRGRDRRHGLGGDARRRNALGGVQWRRRRARRRLGPADCAGLGDAGQAVRQPSAEEARERKCGQAEAEAAQRRRAGPTAQHEHRDRAAPHQAADGADARRGPHLQPRSGAGRAVRRDAFGPAADASHRGGGCAAAQVCG